MLMSSSAGSKSSPSSLNVSGHRRISTASNISLTLAKMRPVFTRDQKFTGSVNSRRASAARETPENERPLKYFPRISRSRFERYQATKTDIKTHIYEMRNLADGVHTLPSGFRFYAKSTRREEAAIHGALTDFALSENFGGIVLAFGYFLREGHDHSEDREGGDDSKYILLMEAHEGQVEDERQKVKVLHALLWIHAHDYVHNDLKLGILNVFKFREENGDIVYVIGDFGTTFYTVSYIKKRDELIDFTNKGKKHFTLNPEKCEKQNDDMYSERTQRVVKCQLQVTERAIKQATSEERKAAQSRYIDHLHVLLEHINIYFSMPEMSEQLYKELASRIFAEGLAGLGSGGGGGHSFPYMSSPECYDARAVAV